VGDRGDERTVKDGTSQLQTLLADRYRIEHELGRGGMATVYLARDIKHDRPVALKVLHPELAASMGSERFLREIQMAARLQHPHILSVHDSGEAAGLLWFTMPYVEGESLRGRLEREHQLPLDDALRISHEAARALDYAHRHGVVHRDIKPENILLTNDGDTLVADFGIGRAIGTSSQDERLTETGVVVGTAAYMSPEQAAGEREIDGRSDVYSLGVVLYEMLAGEPPFTGPTTQAIIARRFSETPRPIRPIRATVPQQLEDVVMSALERLPADRPATAAAFGDALESARGVRSLTQPRRSSRSGLKWMVIAAGVVLMAGLIATMLRSRADSTPKLDASLLSVAPFDVLDSKLGLWREGMVDLLSRNLDGAGPLRTVSPTVVVRRWSGRGDPASAGDLARRTGAGLAVYGSLVGAGRDSVRLRATLLDVVKGTAVEEWDLRDASDRVDRLTDSLTIRILQALGRSGPLGTLRVAGVGSTNLSAIKAFLQGEQQFRRSNWDSALSHYERAIQLDSTFPLALRRVSAVLGWVRTGYDSLSTAYALRAGALNHGLAPRDSVLLVQDSLMAALFKAGPLGRLADTTWAPQISRLFATQALATSRYPDDPETWFYAGEAYAHFGRFVGKTREEQLHAFDRAIALDSAFAPSYIHPVELSAVEGPAAMRRYLRPYLALDPRDLNADGLRLVSAVVDSGPLSNLKDRVASLTPNGMFVAFLALSYLADTAEVSTDVVRYMAGHTGGGPVPNDSAFARRQLGRNLVTRGHLRAGYQAFGPRLDLQFTEAALINAVPAESVDAALREGFAKRFDGSLSVAYLWWARQRDTASLRAAVARAESMVHSSSQGNPNVARYLARSAGAYLALARGDTSAALDGFLALPVPDCPACYYDRLTTAQLLLHRRRYQDAWQMLQAEAPGPTNAPMLSGVMWRLLRGRAAEEIGEKDRAIQSYGWVAGMWRNADPELRPYVKEARDGLARLTAEPK
jgi:eukaryotic-like serine/threonine-protein kinase